MGMFDWALKTERVKKAERATEANAVGATAVEGDLTAQDFGATAEMPERDAKQEAAALLFNFGAPQPQTFGQPGFNGAFAGGTLGNRHILIVKPRTDAEVFAIVEHIKTNEAVIIDFEGVPAIETQRRIDFLSGVACGLGGTIKPLDAHKYIMTPSGIGVR